MSERGLRTRTIAEAVESYVASRTRITQPVSTAEALRKIRYLMPHCHHSHRQLADMVAACAINRGRSVLFDTNAS
jgi:hypothetical protein